MPADTADHDAFDPWPCRKEEHMRKAALALAAAAVAVLVAALVRGPSPQAARAASHREAPLISLDPSADITDFFMFRSYEPGHENNVALIMDVIPAEEPSAGPNYYNFDPSVKYSFSVDNNRDGQADDVEIDFQFKNEIRGVVNDLGLPLSYAAIPGPITSLDSPGLGLRQTYSMTVRKAGKVVLAKGGLIAVPSDVGPRTMPNYQALVDEGTYALDGGGRVFAGQRQDPFSIDLGSVFDTLNFRVNPPLLTAAQDADDTVNPFGVDQLSGFNVHSIAVELPMDMLKADGPNASNVLGAYASTSRARVTVRGRGSSGFTQVQRLANPLVNEVIIGTKDKDAWNATPPENESAFLDYYLKPRLATALELLYGAGSTGCTPFGSPSCSPTNRDDLVNILLRYDGADPHLSELLRLNLAVPPAPLASQRRLSFLAGDGAGWPNGRRPKDDVTDIAVRAVGGPFYIDNRAGDGVNVDDAALLGGFPFLAPPADGRDLMSAGKQTPHIAPKP
jgi:hypothetical protein